jgi:hypothetical protein
MAYEDNKRELLNAFRTLKEKMKRCVYERPVQVLVDTGASLSLINADLWDTISEADKNDIRQTKENVKTTIWELSMSKYRCQWP